MAEKGEILLRLSPEGIHTEYTDPEGITQTKLIDPCDFASLMSAGANITTGILPVGTRFFGRRGNDVSLVVELPPCVREISFRGTKVMIPYPRTVFHITYNESSGSVNRTSVFTSVFPLVNANVMLYSFPFGNVYTGTTRVSANICWGSVRFPPVHSPSQARGIFTQFLDSDFNGDLAGGAYNLPMDFEGERSIHGLILNLNQHLDNEFPPEYLIPTTFSLGKLIQDIMR